MDYKKLEGELKAIIGYGYNQVPGLGAVLYKDGNPCYKLCAGRAYIGKSGYGLDKDFRIVDMLLSSLFSVASIFLYDTNPVRSRCLIASTVAATPCI